MNQPRYGTIEAACRMIGGDSPVHRSTYYKGVREGRYPAPVHPSPGISRVDLDALAARLPRTSEHAA
jgi:hypothetical protein